MPSQLFDNILEKTNRVQIINKKKRMSSFLWKNRLLIDEYFRGLQTTVDTRVETYIAENQHDQAGIDKLNKAREEWFKEADECEASNIAELENSKDRDLELDDEKLLTRFCFIFEFPGDVLETGCFTWRFVSTDTYMSPSQTNCFQMVIYCLNCDECEYEQAPPPGPESMQILFKGVVSECFDVNKITF
jgi:hypothetical protein